MTIKGWATSAGTSRYCDRFEGRATPGHFRKQQDLWLSSVGIGTYLGNPDAETDEAYAAAVATAVTLGANVIDTAANYRFQRSERSVGQALQRLTEMGFARDEILVCTKGGYVPFDGEPPRDFHAYINDTFVRTGVAGFEDFVGSSHCMTPSYLRHQLNQSLTNMGLEAIDVYYIHNPESQLGEVSEPEFYERTGEAFKFLEEARAAGMIKYYGVATWNGFRTKPNSGSFHSLSRLADLASSIGGAAHGFRFIQLPFNLAMPEALVLTNQTLANEQCSTIEAAMALGVTVVASASIFQGRVARGLPREVRQALGSLSTDAQTAIQFVRSAPGVTTALVGMSNLDHVRENLQLVNVPPSTVDDFQQLFSS
jgi:aryl-alcohol dehydrogenase-like predicted oxidoreductase